MSKKLQMGLGVLIAGSMVLAVGCGGGNQAAGGNGVKKGGNINIALDADPPKLDPAFSSALVDRMVFQSLFDKLVDLDSNGKIIPMLADSWDISQDQKSYTFHLHQGVKFQDGTDFNADAVKFNLERDLDKASTRRNELKAIDKITVVDANTIKIDLKQPYAPFLSVLTDRSGMMVSPTAAKKDGANFMAHPVGTGPFMFKDRVKGASITLVKNPNYWQKGLPKADGVTYKIITDSNVELQNLKSGQVDLTDVFPAKELANAKSDPKISVINQPGEGYQGFHLNTTKPPFDNKYLRQAVNTLIDKEAIVNVIMSGTATPANSPFSPSHFAYGDNDKTSAPDLAKAKELLKQGGKPNGFDFTFTIGTTPTNAQLGQMIQSMLKPAGINVTLEKLEFGTLIDKSSKGEFQATQLGWSGRPDPDQNIYDFAVTGGSNNYSKYSNPQVDKLLADARAEGDEAKRHALYDQAMKILQDDTDYVYLYHQNNVFGISKSLQGFNYVPDGLLRTVTLSK
ncbi:MAG: ABC transporter substrate-binding protein [Tumebacillaceae bacterium]